jgi:hypothetical protein
VRLYASCDYQQRRSGQTSVDVADPSDERASPAGLRVARREAPSASVAATMPATCSEAIGDGLTWAALRAMMERAIGRSRAWRDTGLWALRSLEVHLGHDWPVTLARKAPGGRPSELAVAAGHVTAYANVLELALRLELLKETSGFGKARRAIVTDPRPSQLAHSRIQLELASLALKGGSPPELEPNPISRRPADVAFGNARRQLVVETRAVLTSDAWRDNGQWTDELFERIHAVERTHGVHCEGEIRKKLSDTDSDELLRAVEDRARLIAMGASAPPLRMPGIALNVVASENSSGTLRGPSTGGDSWARVGPRIAEKAEQALGSGANWLRIDILDGLWQFTPWAALPLAEKLEGVAAHVRASLGRLEGVILSSGALFAQGVFADDDVSLADGLVGLRRRLTPSRVRETLIIPSEPGAAADPWRQMYAEEPRWLAWALDRLALPTPDAIFAH